MITEQDLREAIAECQGVRNPSSSTCIKLAAYYTIKEHLYPDSMSVNVSKNPTYSYASQPTTQVESVSEFARLVDGREWEEVFPVVDELMETVKVLMPRLYAGVMRKLEQVLIRY